MSKPSNCSKCSNKFMGDIMLQIRLRHVAATDGHSAAEAELNERYDEYHNNGHEEEEDWYWDEAT